MQVAKSTVVVGSTNIKSFSRFENLILTAMLFSILLPNAPQYIFMGLLFILFMVKKKWRMAPLMEGDGRTIALGLFVLFASTWFVGLSHLYISGDWAQWQVVLSDNWHLTGKICLRGIFIYWALKSAFASGWRLEHSLPALSVFLFVYCGYCFLQMAIGINWVHGFSEVLPPNRFNYGVYRVSGLTGHPVTLGYSSLLLALMSLFLLFTPKDRSIKEKRLLLWVSIASCIIVVLSQTRWAILILVCAYSSLAAHLTYRNFRKKRSLLNGWKTIVPLGGGLSILSFGALGRVSELFNSEIDLFERIPRLVFWKVHWQAFLDNPLLGIGFVNRKSEIMDYYSRAGYTSMERKYNAHNIYLQWLADSGLIGALGFCFLMGCLVVISFRLLKNGSINGVIFVTSVLCTGLLQNTFRDSEFIFSFWICFSLLLLGTRYASSHLVNLKMTDIDGRKLT